MDWDISGQFDVIKLNIYAMIKIHTVIISKI